MLGVLGQLRQILPLIQKVIRFSIDVEAGTVKVSSCDEHHGLLIVEAPIKLHFRQGIILPHLHLVI